MNPSTNKKIRNNEFFKFNLCCYNILKIKYILIIKINLIFSKKNTLSENVKDFSIFPYIFHPKSSPFSPPPNSQTKLKELTKTNLG